MIDKEKFRVLCVSTVGALRHTASLVARPFHLYLKLPATWIRHSSFLVLASICYLALSYLGFSKFGDTKVLLISWLLFLFQLLFMFLIVVEFKIGARGYRIVSLLSCLMAGFFVPVNLLAYHYGIHPLMEVWGFIWLLLSLILNSAAIVCLMFADRVRLLAGGLYPGVYSAIILYANIEYVVWISGA